MSHRAQRRRARATVSVPSPVSASLPRPALWLFAALALPRLLRILYPAVWVEDDLLLESAFAASRGLRPYLDFAHAQMPLLEWVAGAYIKIVGASHLRMEVLNAAAIYTTSVLVFFVGRHAVDGRAATAASLLYAWHSLVFRYHVWAREFFVSALVLGAMLALVVSRGERRGSWRHTALGATLLCAGCAIKLTAAIPAAAICLFVAIGQRAPKRAVLLAAMFGCELAAFAVVCWWHYGDSFLFQAFLFHLLKGVDPNGAGPAYIGSLLDVLGPLALLGVLQLHRTRHWNQALGAVTIVVAAQLLFYAVLSPTAWGHNFLDAWPLIAIFAGAGVSWLAEAWPRSPARLVIGTATCTACLLWVTPLDNESTLRGSRYGFGFIPRRELADLATALRNGSGASDEVIAPSFIAFEANRLQAIRYPENYGVMQAANQVRRTAGFWQAREQFGGKGFYELINETSDLWNGEVIRDIAPGGPVDAMIPDSPIQLLPLVNASPAALFDRGFQPALQTEHFVLWLRRNDTANRR